ETQLGPQSMVAAAARALLKLVDLLRRLGFRQRLIDLLTGLAAERLEVRRLCAGHALVAGDPLIGVLPRAVWRAFIVILLRHTSTPLLVSHEAPVREPAGFVACGQSK